MLRTTGRWTGVVAMLIANGCVVYQGERTPDLVGQGAEVRLDASPRIELIHRHEHTMDGAATGGTDLTFKTMTESLERVRQEFPFLANARSGIPKPDFVLEIDTEIAEHNRVGAMVSGFTLMIIPAMLHSDVIAVGRLKHVDGREIGTYRASGELRGVIQILLIVALPALPFTAPGDELLDDTFRDLMLQIAPDLQAALREG